MSDLTFTVSLDRTQFKKQVEEVRRDILGLSNITKSETSKMDGAFKNLSLGIAGYFSANMIQGFVTQLINVRGEFQKTEIAFATMLGNGEKAKALMADMVNLAAKTPFSLQDVSSGAKQLLAFQVPANEVVDTLTRMGNIAAGLSVPLSRINLVYGQVKAKGKLMGDDLRQFTEAGIPMVAELAKKFNKTTGEISAMVSAGKIGFKDVKDVLFSLTNEGGMFYNLMEKQSKSLSGQIANLGDAWDQMLNKIGESNQGILSDGIREITFAVENYENLIEIIKGLVLAYGAYRAAVIVTAAAQSVATASTVKLTTSEIAAGVVKRGLTSAQAALNSTILANPYAIATALIVGLTYAIYKLYSQVSTAQEIQSEYNSILEEHTSKAVSTKAKIDALVTAIKSQNTSESKRIELTKQLDILTGHKLKNLTAERVKTGQLDGDIKNFIKTLYAQAEAMSYVDQLQNLYAKKRKNEDLRNRAKRGDTSVGEYLGAFFDKDTYKTNKGNIGLSAAEIITARTVEEDKAIDKSIAETKKKIDERGDIIASAQTTTDAKINRAISDGSEKTKDTVKKTTEDVEKIYGENTLKGLQQRISKLNEIMETSVIGSDKYNNAKSQKSALEERLKTLTQSFDEQINEIKRQFSVRDQLLQSGYSKDVVDGMFPEIKDKNLIQSLQEQAKAIKDILDAGKGDSATSENFISLNEQIRVLLGQKSELENFSKLLNDGKQGKSSSEYIDFLNSQKTTGGTEQDAAKNAEIDRRIEYEKQAIADAYRSFIDAHLSYEQQKTKITKDYDELRKQAKTKAELDAIDKAQRNDLSALALKEFQDSDAWIKGFEDLANISNKELDKVIAEFEKFQSEAAKSLSPTDLKTYMDALRQLKNEVLTRNPFKALSDAVKEYIKDLKEGKGTTESMINVFKAVSASANLVNSTISTGLEIADSLGVQMSDSTKEVVSHVQTTITGIGDLAAGIASKDPAQIIKGIAGVVKGLAGLFNGDRKHEKRIKEWAKQVEGLKEKYEELQNQVKKTLGEDVYADQQKIISNLREQQALLTKMMNEEKKKKKSDSNKVKDYQNQIKSIDQQIEEMYDNISKSILQTDAKELANQLADALIEAYSKGEDAASAYGKVADDVMKQAVKNALKLQLLEKPMQEIIKQMLKNMGYDEQGNGAFDGLTKEERDQLKAMMASASQNYMDALGAYEDLFGESAANAQGLKGDIKGITEKTAGALEGQINAIRIYQVEALNISKENNKIFIDSLKNLVMIEYNTRDLKYIRQDIAELNSKVSKPLAGLNN